jgi:hypothetical protein
MAFDLEDFLLDGLNGMFGGLSVRDRPLLRGKCNCSHDRLGQHKLTRGHDCRVYAHYQCPTCNRTWTSGNSYYLPLSDSYRKQACKGCNRWFQPISASQLGGGSGATGGPPHDTARCEKCKLLGRNCRDQQR